MTGNVPARNVVVGYFFFSTIFFCLILFGCAVNPATKRYQLMIVSEEQEFEMGQRIDKEVRDQMGVYLELPELRTLVKQVGENIGRNTDRPNLIYRVEIVDSPDVNAFALPGGFIYVQRGLLERMNSVDDLASVLGHEISHVAARHSAAQISKVQLLNIGLIGLAVATKGAIQDYGNLINVGAALAFNKFSRDDEREADYYGMRYVTKTGYNPCASTEVMKIIQALEVREPSAVEAWFMTHPPTEERVADLTRELEGIRIEQPTALTLPRQRNEYVKLLDGLAVGEWNGNEITSGDRYYNKEFLLSIRIPEGWQAKINSKQYTAIFAQPKKRFYAFFNIEPLRVLKTTEEYFSDFEKYVLHQGLNKVQAMSLNSVLAHGALTGIYQGYDPDLGRIMSEAMAFVQGANGYSIIGISTESGFEEIRPRVESMLGSLQFISPKEASELKPPRLRVHEVKSGETWASVTKEYYGSSEDAQKLAEYNGFELTKDPDPGMLIKIPPSLRL